MTEEIPENGIALLFVSDFRGAGGNAEVQDFTSIRKIFYKLSKLDFELPICDLGDLVSGKTVEDSHYILQEVLSVCHYKNTIPVIIGGSNDFAYSLFSALRTSRSLPFISSSVSLAKSKRWQRDRIVGKTL